MVGRRTVEFPPSNSRAKILSFLREKGDWFSMSGLATGIGMNHNTVKKTLPEMVKGGDVKQRETTQRENKQAVTQYRAV